MHFNVSQLSLLTFKMVLMTLMLALMKVYFSLLYAECYWMLIKNAKIVIESDLCANVRIFALMNVSIGRHFTEWTAKGVIPDDKLPIILAVVTPIVVLAVFAGVFAWWLWRRNKDKKMANKGNYIKLYN